MTTDFRAGLAVAELRHRQDDTKLAAGPAG